MIGQRGVETGIDQKRASRPVLPGQKLQGMEGANSMFFGWPTVFSCMHFMRRAK